MIILVIKEADGDCPCADQISKEYPESSIFRYKQYSDQELLEAIHGPALIVLNHKMAIPHAKLLRTAAGEMLIRIMVILEEGFGKHAVNVRIAGADICLAKPFDPALLLRAIEDEGSTLRRMAEAMALVKSQACINRRYTLTQMLGAGRHAVVFLAQDLEANTTVTIKLLRKSLAGSPEFMEEFQVLAEKYKLITAPSMATLLDYGSWNGYAYMAINLGKAENLYEVMARRELDPSEIAKVGLAVTRALIAIKKQDVLHFDIKPENILCYKDQYYLTEFGSMLPFSKPDSTGYYYWPDSAYTSPEGFVDDGAFTIRSDVYSLGMVLYVLARRENPFAGRPCTWELNRRVTENMINFLEENPLENCQPLAITIEAMTLVRYDARPRLRDLEIIFYHQFIIMADTPAVEMSGGSALQTSRASTISSAASDGEHGHTTLVFTGALKLGARKYLSNNSSKGAGWSIFGNLPLKKRIMLVVLALVMLVSLSCGGYWLGGRSVIRTYYEQGPLQMFSCYNGHTKALRTLNFRDIRCPECGDETSPSYTCNRCGEIFGLTLWPRRNMTDEESAEFEERQMRCPFCKSTDIVPTPLPAQEGGSRKTP
ncbi:MAG: protein kinase [Oligosphaeraceae bacterium]|nr:protein kinase [Oligosphaeraceae bacterium]